MSTMTSRAAQAAGLRALTRTYRLPQEEEMLGHVVADLKRGKIKHALVRERGGVSVWRSAGPRGPVDGRLLMVDGQSSQAPRRINCRE